MNISKIFTAAALLFSTLAMISCSGDKYHVSGNITQAPDSMLYFENMSLNGPVVLDSVKLNKDGSFDFDGDALKQPEFFRLRIDKQIINIALDSVQHVEIQAAYPTMSSDYKVEGSEQCAKIKELALMQMKLQGDINAIEKNPNISYAQEGDSITTIVSAYKDMVKRNFIFNAPMTPSAYFALFQSVTIEHQPVLIFNPQNNKEDIKVFAAVATSWDTYYPHAERGQNLHNIAIEGMKNIRIIEAEQQNATIDASKIQSSGLIDISLPDNKGTQRKLTDLKGKVVLLDFHVFATKESTQRIMALRDLYNKYHDRGLEIYQVSLDPNEHFWKENVAALPWISVRDEQGTASPAAARYNVRIIPTFFLIDRNNTLVKRDAQIKDLDAEVAKLL